MIYEHPTDFFWRSELSEERKKEIAAWVKSLPKDKQTMLEDVIKDTKNSTRWESICDGPSL